MKRAVDKLAAFVAARDARPLEGRAKIPAAHPSGSSTIRRATLQVLRIKDRGSGRRGEIGRWRVQRACSFRPAAPAATTPPIPSSPPAPDDAPDDGAGGGWRGERAPSAARGRTRAGTPARRPETYARDGPDGPGERRRIARRRRRAPTPTRPAIVPLADRPRPRRDERVLPRPARAGTAGITPRPGRVR